MGIYEKLYPWQKKLIDNFKDRKSYGLFLDCGLGKTPISLGFTEVNNCTKLIIITINSKALETIEDDGWLKWASYSNINYKMYSKKEIFNKKQKVSFDNDPSLILLNYESLYERSKDRKQNIQLKSEIIDFIKNCKGHNIGIIIDESHKIKDTSTIQSKAIKEIKKLCNVYSKNVYSYLLTGTPFTQGFIDLYAQLNFLGCEMNKTTFIDNFCIRGHVGGLYEWQQPIVSYKNIDDLYKLVHKYAITIKSEDVMDLPEQIFVNHISPQSKEFRLLSCSKLPYKFINEELEKRNLPLLDVKSIRSKNKIVNNPFYCNLAYPEVKWLAETSATLWMRCREISVGFQGNREDYEYYNNTRLNSVKEFLANHEDNYLIFCNYMPELVDVYYICEELGYNVDAYFSEVKSTYFYNKYKNMSEEERLTNKKNVIVANFASGSTAMNWQLYNKCIIVSLPIYKDWEQGIKRIHRNGQKDNCIYHIFYENNWLDLGMKKALEEKSDYNKEMFEEDLKRVNDLMNEEKE